MSDHVCQSRPGDRGCFICGNTAFRGYSASKRYIPAERHDGRMLDEFGYRIDGTTLEPVDSLEIFDP